MIAESGGIRPPLRGFPHHIVITKPLLRPGTQLTRCNVDWVRTERNLTRRLDRVFARLDREPERPAHIDVPVMSRHRVVLFSATLAFYLAIVWAW